MFKQVLVRILGYGLAVAVAIGIGLSLPKFVALIIGFFINSPAPERDLEGIDIPHEEFTLDNGLRVIVHTDRLTPVVSMNTWYHVGSKNEPEGQTGFAHLFEHLMFQGSEHYNDEYFKPLTEVGATGINGTTNADRTNYFQTVPTEAVERMLFLESDRLTHLLGAVTQERLDEQRGVVQNEKRQRANQPFGTAFEHMLRGVFPPGHPYRHPVIGSMEDLNAASLDDVYEWFEDYYGASNVVIALAGDIDVETARPLMEKYYGDAPAGEPVARLETWVPELPDNRREILHDRAATGLIYRVWPIPPTTRESVSLSLWGDAFASGPTAPLYKALVEEHKLASDVSASPIDFEVAGLFYVYVSLLPDADPDAARRVLDETLEEFLRSGPDSKRLERIKTQSLTNTVRGLERPATKASILVSGAVFHDDPVYFKRELASLTEATARSVEKVAEAWLTRPYYELTGLPFGEYVSSEEGTDRSELPGLGEPSRLEFPQIEERTLDQGIRLVLARRENLPVTDVTIRFDFGDVDEPDDSLGIASTAFGQLISGTGSRDAEEISAEIERLGGYVRPSVGTLTSDVSTGGLSENLPALLALVADLLQDPSYPEDKLSILKGQWIADIESQRTDPGAAARTLLNETVFGASHPLGRRTRESHVNAISRASLVAYHRDRLLGQPFEVFAVGDVTMDELADMVATAFEDWPASQPQVAATAPAIVPEADAVRIFMVDMPGTEQSVILAGQVAPPTPSEPAVEEAIANEIIGGSFVSRINMNLREDKAWSYGARTGLSTSVFQRMFSVSTSVQVDKTAESLTEINRELSEYLSSQPASEEEFALALERRIRSLSSSFQTGQSLLASLTNSDYLSRPWNYPVLYGEALTEVSLDEVRVAANELIDPQRLTYVIAGDLSVMEGSVRALGLGEVITIDADGEIVNDTTDA